MKLVEIITSRFPMKGYIALTIAPFIFIRRENQGLFTGKVKSHEMIHATQQMECLFAGALAALLAVDFGAGWWSAVFLFSFYLIYALEFLVKLPFCGFSIKAAYRSISFEQEAFRWEGDKYYLKIRPPYVWVFDINSIEK